MAAITDRDTFSALLRTDLTSFIIKVFQTVSPGDKYVHNWHVEAIAHELTRCRDGHNTRLLITQPPRSLKSICTSVAYVAWALGHNPKLRFICVSYSQELSIELARQFRLVIDSEWYRALFPATRLKKDTGTECVTTAGGGRVATSIGGTLTGRGADVIIIDDPLKAEESGSDTARKRVIDWYSGTLTTRLNDKRKGAIIVVMQRLHEDDLAGHLIASGEAWRRLDLPAIAIEDEDIPIGRGESYRRKEGEVLQPMREPLEALNRQKLALGSIGFSAQYQQRPVPIEGNLVKREWFGRYERAPEGQGVRVVQSWDTASATGERNDYSVCVTAAVHKKRYYILDIRRERLTYPDLRRKVAAHAAQWNANILLIENAGPGMHLVQELRRTPPANCPRPIAFKPEGEKAVRMEAASAVVERGDVLLPEDAPWLSLFLNEILAFPNARHDDQVDAFSQLLNYEQKRRPYNVGMAPQLIVMQEPDDSLW